MKRGVASVLVVMALCASCLASSTLLDYEKRVFRAAEQIERIKMDQDYGDEGIEYIRTLLPVSEQVEIESRTISVDNSWLHSQLDAIFAEGNMHRRAALLSATGDRLRALDDSLRRAEGVNNTVTDDDQAREHIREILSRSDYRERQESRLSKLIKEARRRVLEFLHELYERVVSTIFGAGSGVSWFLRGLIVVVVLLGVISLARMVHRLGPRKKREKKRTVLGEEMEEGTTGAELADAALGLAKAGEFRSAVRKLYIALLYELAERNLIELSADTTNHEYLQKVSRFSGLVPAMRYLTEKFDYFWYGMFPSSEADFSECLSKYREALLCAQGLGQKST